MFFFYQVFRGLPEADDPQGGVHVPLQRVPALLVPNGSLVLHFLADLGGNQKIGGKLQLLIRASLISSRLIDFGGISKQLLVVFCWLMIEPFMSNQMVSPRLIGL